MRTSIICILYLKLPDAQLSQRNRAAGCVSFGQKWKIGTGRQYFTDIIGLSSTTVIQSACKSVEFGEKNAKLRLLRRSRSFRSSRSVPIESPYTTSY